jgi:hypothetical protein
MPSPEAFSSPHSTASGAGGHTPARPFLSALRGLFSPAASALVHWDRGSAGLNLDAATPARNNAGVV